MSLPPALAKKIERAAARNNTTVSAWLASTAERQLKLEDGRRAVAEWEAEHGAFTPAELERGRAIVRTSLGLPARGSKRTAS